MCIRKNTRVGVVLAFGHCCKFFVHFFLSNYFWYMAGISFMGTVMAGSFQEEEHCRFGSACTHGWSLGHVVTPDDSNTALF